MTKDAGIRTALNAKDLVEHDVFPDVILKATPEPDTDQKVADVLSRWAGIVEIVPRHVQSPPCITRYGTAFVRYDGRIAVNWCVGDSDEHLFDAKTGQCIESSDGRMRDWRIAPWEMHRYNAEDTRKYVAAVETGGMSVGTSSKEDQDFVARKAADVESTERKERKDIQANPLWNIERHDVPLHRRQVLVVVSSGLFAGCSNTEVAKNAGTPVTNALLELAAATTKDDEITVCQTGDSLIGRRVDLVITTDDLLSIMDSTESINAAWWKMVVLPRCVPTSRILLVSSVQATRRAMELSAPVSTVHA
jgi:hypothetical protein